MAKRPDRSLKTIIEGVSSNTITKANDLYEHQQELIKSKSSSIHLPLGSRSVRYELISVPYNEIELSTTVLESNARDQEFLNNETLSDILASLIKDGQQFPAIGQRINNKIVVIDGSRRRAACLIAKKTFLIYVTDEDITEEEASFQSWVGNAHKQISIYEYGIKWKSMIDKGLYKDPKELALFLNKSDSIVYDAINALSIPKELLLTFPAASDLGRPALNKIRKALKENPNFDLDEVLIAAYEHCDSLNLIQNNIKDKNKKHLEFIISVLSKSKQKIKAQVLLGKNKSSARIMKTKKGFNIVFEKLTKKQTETLENMVKQFLSDE